MFAAGQVEIGGPTVDGDVRKAAESLNDPHPVEGDEKKKPKRSRQVAENALEQMEPADAAQSAGEKHQAVLHIALAPAAVTLGVFNQALRRFLVAAGEIVSKPDLPILAQEQGGFHEVMAENLAAEGVAAGQLRQVARVHKGVGADDGVMAPIVAATLRPVVQAGDEN